MRVGVDRRTGEVLTGWAHCRQSIEVILTTAIGSVVMLREFGSECPPLQDRPGNSLEIARFQIAAAEALRKWEPGFRLKTIRPVTLDAGGVAEFEIAGVFYPNGHVGDYRMAETRTLVLA